MSDKAEPKEEIKQEQTQTPPETKPPTPEEIEAQKKRTLYAMFGEGEDPDKQPEQKVAEPQEEKPKEDDKPKEEVKEEPKEEKSKEEKPKAEDEKKAKRKRTKAIIQPEEDDTKLERAAQRGAEKAISSLSDDKSQAKEVKVEPSKLPADYQRDLEIIQRMELDDPKHRGLSDKMQQFYRKEAAYIEAWEKDNPGKEFDSEETEHEDFYAKSMPAVDTTDFEKAKENLIIARVEAKAEAKIAEREARQKFETSKTQVEEQANTDVIKGILGNVDKDALKDLFDDGNITKETVAALKDNDPALFDMIDNQIVKAQKLVMELRKLSQHGDFYKYDPNLTIRLPNKEIISPHSFLTNYAIQLETDISEMDSSDSVKDGKKFLSQQDMQERRQRINSTLTGKQRESALRDLSNRYWSLTAEDIERALIADNAVVINEYSKKYYSSIEKRVASKNGKASVATPKDKSVSEESKPKKDKPDSPTTAASSDKLNNTGVGNSKGVLTAETVLKSMWD